MTTKDCVIEVEIEGVRSYIGPFPSLTSAWEYVNDHQSSNRTMIHQLSKPLQYVFKIDPNQTTIDEQIDAVHDHVG